MSRCGKIKFNMVCSPEVKLSDDRLSACRKSYSDGSLHSFLFSDQCLSVDDDFQIQIIHMISLPYESFQFGVISENPNNLTQIITEKEILKNSLSLKNDILYHQNDENVITSEEYDLNLTKICEGDLIGIRITETGELFFTYNGVSYRKAADNIPKNIWAFVNLNGRCSVISIISSNSSITSSHKDRWIKKLRNAQEYVITDEDADMCFHHYCGKEVILTENNRVAKRKNPTNEFRNAVVISKSPLVPDIMFRLRIEGLINKWNGSIELGVTFHNPDMFELPTAMNNLRSGTLVLSGNSILTNGHGTRLPYCTTSLDDLKIGDEIGIVRKNNSNVHFFINNEDLGVAGNIPIEKDLWVIADLYGRTIKVSITNNKDKYSKTESLVKMDLNFEDVENNLVFHSIAGKNVKLTDECTRASRINDQEFNNGVVFTNRPLRVGERWSVKLVRCVDQWAGNMEVGLTTKCPNDGDIPSTMTDLIDGYTIMFTSNGLIVNGSPLSQSDQQFDPNDIHPILLSGLLNLVEGNILGVQLVDKCKIQFFINGADLGIILLNVEYVLYGVIDLYGKAAEVSLCVQGSYLVTEDTEIPVKSCISMTNDDNPSELDSPTNYQSLLYSEENNDFGRSFSLLQSESGLCDALKEADRSFLRLLSGNDELNRIIRDTSHQPLVFHEVHGRNVILTNSGRTAYRPSPYNEFKNALVMSSRPLETDEIFEICIDKMTDHWSGSLEMGVTLNNPSELNFPGTLSQLDKDCWILSGSCIMNNGITARNDYSLDMDAITVNSKIGLIRRRSGMLHFLLDGRDMGAAYFEVPPGIYAILDLYGQCSKVTITNKTGATLTGDQSINSLLETSNCDSFLIREPEAVMQSNDTCNVSNGPSRLSPFDRVMLVFKENLSGLSEDDSCATISHQLCMAGHDTVTSFNGVLDNDTSNNLFNGESIFGDGIRWNESLGFKCENVKRNCVVQSTCPLKTSIYYEFCFHMSKIQNQNIDHLSFGFTTEKFSSQRYLALNMLHLNQPSWSFLGEKLYIDNRLHSINFAPILSEFKKRILLGVYLHENNNLELFANRIRIVLLNINNHQNVYMLTNLSGWYDSFTTVDMLQKVNVDITFLGSPIQTPYGSYVTKDDLAGIQSLENQSVESETNIFSENLDIDDPLMIRILKELYELLPLFMTSLKGIETSRLIEKIVVSNNDIVLSIKRDIENGNAYKFAQKNNVRNLLIDELSKRFSHIVDLRHLGNSHHEIARALRRKVLMHGVSYNGNSKAFVVPHSCLHIEESKLSRLKFGCDYGLGIINQELKSEKYQAYEFHLANTSSGNFSTSNLSVGLFCIESKHFHKAEDALRFLMSMPSPKHIRSLSNHLNFQLSLFESESPALVLIIEDDSVFLNERQICQKIPFNHGNMAAIQSISFKLRESDTAFTDVYLSVKTADSNNNYLILSEPLFNSWRHKRAVLSEVVDYLYIPFVWLKNRISVSIMTGSGNVSQCILGSNQANRREWLEKHYNDELNKESSQISINESVDPYERQCLSLKRSVFVKSSLSLPDTYFKNKTAICFCNNCRIPTMGSANLNSEICEVLIKGDPAKEFRLPLGWVKYNIRLKREVRSYLSLWHLAYLTVSPLLVHKLLAFSDPVSFLKYADHSLIPVISWLTMRSFTDVSPPQHKLSIIVSPWKPLPGCYINEDRCILPCVDWEINCYDPYLRTDTAAQVALEVRVKPNTYQSTEYRLLSENAVDEKYVVVKELDGGCCKKTAEMSPSRSINSKTVWILNGELNSVVISGLLIKII